MLQYLASPLKARLHDYISHFSARSLVHNCGLPSVKKASLHCSSSCCLSLNFTAYYLHCIYVRRSTEWKYSLNAFMAACLETYFNTFWSRKPSPIFPSVNMSLSTLTSKLSQQDLLRWRHTFQSLTAVKPLSSCIYREVSLKQHLQPSDVNFDRHLQERYRQGLKLVFKYDKGFVNQSYEVWGRLQTYSTDSGFIYISVNYPSALEVSYGQILTHCHHAYKFVCQLCMRSWEENWGTDPARIVISGSSLLVNILDTQDDSRLRLIFHY